MESNNVKPNVLAASLVSAMATMAEMVHIQLHQLLDAKDPSRLFQNRLVDKHVDHHTICTFLGCNPTSKPEHWTKEVRYQALDGLAEMIAFGHTQSNVLMADEDD